MQAGKRKVFLHPGDFLFGEPGTHIHTVLGSCIAITLWHPILNIGGMCHFVLPTRKLNDGDGKLDGRYGDEAMQWFDQAVFLHGTQYAEYTCKIFGGANMFGQNANSKEDLIGEKNAAAAMQFLMARKAEISVVHVGEEGHRRIAFDVETGDVWVKHDDAAGKRMSSISGKN